MRSKRERKRKATSSLRQKGAKQQALVPFSSVPDSNAPVLPELVKAGSPAEVEVQPHASLSKAQQRKLKQVEAAAQQRGLRHQLYGELEKHSLTQEQACLLQGSASRGAKATRKQELAHALKRGRAGLPVDSDLGLHQSPASSQALYVGLGPSISQSRNQSSQQGRQGIAQPSTDVTAAGLRSQRKEPSLASLRQGKANLSIPVRLAVARRHRCLNSCSSLDMDAANFAERAGLIGVTQPRRLAAISSAQRVAAELGHKVGSSVGYQVRYDRQQDFLLRRYSIIIIDEAHERSLNSDILLGMLSRIVPLRQKMASAAASGVQPLRLVIMSATLRTEILLPTAACFHRHPPVVHVPARQFPVTVHFNRRTELHDYVGAAFAKMPGAAFTGCKIHRQLPPGESIDRPGQTAEQSHQDVAWHAEGDDALVETDEEEDVVVLGDPSLIAADADKGPDQGKDDEEGIRAPIQALPLYALLPAAAQARVFQPAPPGHRQVIVATNVAETSLTIPGIRYVVDAGRAKQRLLEEGHTGMARFEVRWISKASAEQRAGRAGRTGPGHCYRLYSSAHYNDTFPKHTPPEILNTALEGVVLLLKAMAVDKVENFPLPTSVEPSALAAAERCLVALAALHPDTRALTQLGTSMAALPISPRHARMIHQVVADAEAGRKGAQKALSYAIALAAALDSESPFVRPDSLAVCLSHSSKLCDILDWPSRDAQSTLNGSPPDDSDVGRAP
ncbi:hypothetical protein WJX84_008573 [Apatococcus fuscideae]|uniref:Uncharacterized protein n=1 Tax=Apatococcus fuscideae TaxID=2026836 RepID=A0AAW1SZJ4_9CHLO